MSWGKWDGLQRWSEEGRRGSSEQGVGWPDLTLCALALGLQNLGVGIFFGGDDNFILAGFVKQGGTLLDWSLPLGNRFYESASVPLIGVLFGGVARIVSCYCVASQNTRHDPFIGILKNFLSTDNFTSFSLIHFLSVVIIIKMSSIWTQTPQNKAFSRFIQYLSLTHSQRSHSE